MPLFLKPRLQTLISFKIKTFCIFPIYSYSDEAVRLEGLPGEEADGRTDSTVKLLLQGLGERRLHLQVRI
jgi:hypothetical protein